MLLSHLYVKFAMRVDSSVNNVKRATLFQWIKRTVLMNAQQILVMIQKKLVNQQKLLTVYNVIQAELLVQNAVNHIIYPREMINVRKFVMKGLADKKILLVLLLMLINVNYVQMKVIYVQNVKILIIFLLMDYNARKLAIQAILFFTFILL